MFILLRCSVTQWNGKNYASYDILNNTKSETIQQITLVNLFKMFMFACFSIKYYKSSITLGKFSFNALFNKSASKSSHIPNIHVPVCQMFPTKMLYNWDYMGGFYYIIHNWINRQIWFTPSDSNVWPIIQPHQSLM